MFLSGILASIAFLFPVSWGENQMLSGIQVQRGCILIGRQWLGPRIWVEKSLNDPQLTSLDQIL